MKKNTTLLITAVVAIALFTGIVNTNNFNQSATEAAAVEEVQNNVTTSTIPPSEVPAQVNIPKYERSSFGKSWKSVGGGCNYRQSVLAEKLTDVTFKAGSDCKVESGVLEDFYTNTVIQFSSTTPTAVPIDHIYSLSEAWQDGAYAWDYETRVAFANDMGNLTPTNQYTNSWKSDKSPHEMFVCVTNTTADCAPRTEITKWDGYVAAYKNIAKKYNLTISVEDAQALDALSWLN